MDVTIELLLIHNKLDYSFFCCANNNALRASISSFRFFLSSHTASYLISGRHPDNYLNMTPLLIWYKHRDNLLPLNTNYE